MRTILMIRHGETDANKKKQVQGNLPIPLNSKGERQAQALAQALREEKFEIITSGALRAHQTALAIASHHEGMQVRLEDGLREPGFGGFTGLTDSEIKERYPEAYAAWKNRELDTPFPEDENGRKGETLRGFSERVIKIVTSIAKEQESGKVVLVTHGGVLDCVYREAVGMKLGAPRDFKIPNASINRFTWDEETEALRLEEWGNVEHLENFDSVALDEIDR